MTNNEITKSETYKLLKKHLQNFGRTKTRNYCLQLQKLLETEEEKNHLKKVQQVLFFEKVKRLQKP